MILKNEDCLDYLSDIETESVDMIVVDPPYFQIVKNDWDNQWKTEDDYLAWCAKWTREASRVLKKGGCLFVWGTTKTDTFLKYKLNVLNSIDELQYQNWIIWAYDWGGRTKKKFPRKHEDLLMYSKGKEFLFNADDVRVERAVKVNYEANRCDRRRSIRCFRSSIEKEQCIYEGKDSYRRLVQKQSYNI